jgi:negative regulator of sigma E activity
MNQPQTLRHGEGPLESRKKLLIAESELNRAQLVQELETIKDKFHSLANQARTVSSLASAAATLIAGIASLRRKKESAPAAEKPSWLQTIVKGAGLISTVWQKFRPQSREQK